MWDHRGWCLLEKSIHLLQAFLLQQTLVPTVFTIWSSTQHLCLLSTACWEMCLLSTAVGWDVCLLRSGWCVLWVMSTPNVCLLSSRWLLLQCEMCVYCWWCLLQICVYLVAGDVYLWVVSTADVCLLCSGWCLLQQQRGGMHCCLLPAGAARQKTPTHHAHNHHHTSHITLIIIITHHAHNHHHTSCQ